MIMPTETRDITIPPRHPLGRKARQDLTMLLRDIEPVERVEQNEAVALSNRNGSSRAIPAVMPGAAGSTARKDADQRQLTAFLARHRLERNTTTAKLFPVSSPLAAAIWDDFSKARSVEPKKQEKFDRGRIAPMSRTQCLVWASRASTET
jgi:hypothetical protein